MLKRFFSIILMIVAMSNVALADDWVAKKLRGGVFVFQSGEWVQIKRGFVVSDNSAIQTAKGARVLFARGKETIDIHANTRIKISDKNGAKRTVVSQDFGSITVDVEKRNVQHFEVRSPLLAAVVKGTKFTVTSSKTTASIDVVRGRVEVRDEKAGMKVDVKPRQKVKLSAKEKPVLTVEGSGEKEPIRSTSDGRVLSVKQIIKKIEKARPAAPVRMAQVEKIAAQQGAPLTKSDLEYAAEKELKAAKKSGEVNSQDAAQASGAARNATQNAISAAAAADQAKAEKKAAEKALKDAKKSGDAAAIATAEDIVAEAKVKDKAADKASKDAKKDAKDADKAAQDVAKDADKAAKDADKAAKDADKLADKAAKDAEKAAKDAAKDAEKAAKDAEKATPEPKPKPEPKAKAVKKEKKDKEK